MLERVDGLLAMVDGRCVVVLLRSALLFVHVSRGSKGIDEIVGSKKGGKT